MMGHNMIKINLLVLLLLYISPSYAEKLYDIKSYCKNNKCSKMIKKIKVGKFYFKARNCETKDHRKCQI